MKAVPFPSPQRPESTPQAASAAAAQHHPAGQRGFLGRFLAIWLPSLAVLAAVVWAFYAVQAKSAQALLKAAEREAIQISVQASVTESANVRADLLYLSDQYTLLDDASRSVADVHAALAARFSAFAMRKQLYGRVRLLDLQGREVVRVDWNDGTPIGVPRERLQDQSRRDYFTAALALQRGEIHVSPLDGNAAPGAAPEPLKPSLHIATPVYDRRGNKRGVIVLDYLAESFLERLGSVRESDHERGEMWLLNPDGLPLLEERRGVDPNVMLPRDADPPLSTRDPVAWTAIRSARGEGQVMTDLGLYTYAWIRPLAQPGSSANTAQRALLAAYKPIVDVEAVGATLARRLGILFGALALLFAFAAWSITFYSMRKRAAEESVRASEARFRALLESAPDAIMIADAEGRIALANAQAEKYFGYTREELLHQPIEILVPESLRERHVSHRAYYAADPYPRPMGAGLELFGRRKDGSEFPIEISLSPLHTAQGMVVTAIIRDISARKQIERQHKDAQTRYRELMDNLPVGIYRKTAGADGRFLEVNPALVSMLEAESAETLLERPLATFRTADGRPLFGDDEGPLEGVVNTEIELLTLKGRPFQGAIRARLRREDDRTFYDGVIEDVTARKEIARQLESRTAELEATNRELEAFSYSVSHDLRAPLRAIDGFSRILLTDYAERLDETGRDRLGRVRRAAQHMGTLIDDLLKLSRVTRTELKREDIDLSALAEDVANELRRQAPEREVAFDIAPALHANGDRGLLRVVLDNLLGNAWKFTGGRSDARISLAAETRDGETVYVVRDNGAGFDMAYADKLFGVFQRLHDAGEFPGTGIGLATVQRVVHKHGGRIWAESEVGGGARFYFTLEAEGGT